MDNYNFFYIIYIHHKFHVNTSISMHEHDFHTTNMLFKFFAITHKKKNPGLAENSPKNSVQTVQKQSQKFSPDCPKTIPKILSVLSENNPKNYVQIVRKQSQKLCSDYPKTIPKCQPGLLKNSPINSIRTV